MLTAYEARELSKVKYELGRLDEAVRGAVGRGERKITTQSEEHMEGDKSFPSLSVFGKLIKEAVEKLGYKTEWGRVSEYAVPFSGGISGEDRYAKYALTITW